MARTPEFIDVGAVEAWDAWFRWRERDALKDVSIRDTWQRVARALASPDMEQRVLDAMESWRLLPDERVLATAGTPVQAWPDNELAAVVNIAAFVDEPGVPGDSLDLKAIEDTASLAVDVLESALTKSPYPSIHIGMALRIGLVGFADAMALMDIPYASQRARLLAQEISLALARGSLRRSIGLARQWGPRVNIVRHSPIASRLRSIAPELAKEAEIHGLRHASLTAISSHPRLARLANNVADAAKPLACARDAAHVMVGALPCPGMQGYAIEWSRRHGALPQQLAALLQAATAPVSSQLVVRGAFQQWMDEPMGSATAISCGH